ncbi:hypothetical protein HAX54_011288 [Datura stramonium]|uniref:Uncharacterized protein n=1 Tax=Datura stramonium TaxID=4076 RepID=A0ABS8Y4M5_DATST|nr:hypothetical protein [Datura stramonium]
MRKRIRNDPFDSMDMNFLGGAGDNDEPQSVTGLLDSTRDTFCFPTLLNHKGDVPLSSFNVTENFPDVVEEKVAPAENQSTSYLEFPVLDCGLAFHDIGYSPTPPEMPDWSTIGDIAVPALPDFEEEQNMQKTFVVPIDGNSINGCSIPSTDDYLAELSESNLHSTDEEELLFIDPDGNETIDKESGDKCVHHYSDKPPVSSSEFQMLSSALTVNPAFPEMRGGVICCTLSTEDPKGVPSNDDVFPVLMPPTSFSSVTHWKYDEIIIHYPLAKDLSNNQKANEGRAVLKKKEQNCHSEYSNSFQMNEPPSQAERYSQYKVKHELPNDNNQYVEREESADF